MLGMAAAVSATVQAIQVAQQRRLARARGTDERHHLAAADLERDIAQSRLRRRRLLCKLAHVDREVVHEVSKARELRAEAII